MHLPRDGAPGPCPTGFSTSGFSSPALYIDYLFFVNTPLITFPHTKPLQQPNSAYPANRNKLLCCIPTKPCQLAPKSPLLETVLKCRFPRPAPKAPSSVGLGWGPNISISNKLFGDTAAAALEWQLRRLPPPPTHHPSTPCARLSLCPAWSCQELPAAQSDSGHMLGPPNTG